MTIIPTTAQEIKQAEKVCIDSLRSALGIITKSPDKRGKSLLVVPFSKGSVELENWRIEEKKKDLARGQELFPGERICICERILAFMAGSVKLEAGAGKAWLKGLARCGSIWVCPVCAPIKAMIRQEEVNTGISRHDGHIWFATLTMRHHRNETIEKTLGDLKGALGKLKESRFWREFPQIGHITATEAPWNPNGGWHPHIHMLMFCERGETGSIPSACVYQRFSDEWKRSLKKMGREAIDHIGLTVQPGEAAGKYIAKWGLGAELTRNDLKKGKNGSFTSFELLRMSRQESLSPEEREAYGYLYKSFCRGMKGTRQVNWSQGLKKKLLEEREEESNSEEEVEEVELGILPEDQIEFRASMTIQAWRKVVKRGIEGRLLVEARMGRYEKVVEMLREVLGERVRSRTRGDPGIEGVTIWMKSWQV